MKTLIIEVTDRDFRKYKLRRGTMKLSELKKQIQTELLQSVLERSRSMAKKFGLSSMSSREINKIVSRTRQSA